MKIDSCPPDNIFDLSSKDMCSPKALTGVLGWGRTYPCHSIIYYLEDNESSSETLTRVGFEGGSKGCNGSLRLITPSSGRKTLSDL